jgi:septum formation protein
LTEHGFSFEIVPAHVDESVLPGETPPDHVVRVAREKARAVAPRFPDSIVLGADTIIAFEGRVLGKPKDSEDAVRMLRDLSGKDHEVLTGFCVRVDLPEREVSEVVATRVHFRDLGSDEINEYVKSGEPLDKAGAYAIQGGAKRFVESVAGSIANIVGLPIERIEPVLRAWGAPKSPESASS